MSDDSREVENLLHAYAEYIDAGRLDDLAALFAHGRILPTPDTPSDEVREGTAAVRSMYNGVRLYDDGTPKTKHLINNAIIDVNPEAGTATSRSSYTVTQATEALPLQVIITGRYLDTFTRVDGRWWFDTRVIHVDQLGDLTHHLSFTIPGAPQESST